MLSFRDGTSAGRERLVRLSGGFRTRPARGPDTAAGTNAGRPCIQHSEKARASAARSRRPSAQTGGAAPAALRHGRRIGHQGPDGRRQVSRRSLAIHPREARRQEADAGKIGDHALDHAAHHDAQDHEAARATRAHQEGADGCHEGCE